MEVGSVMYKMGGVRWVEYMASEFTVGQHDKNYMVLDLSTSTSSSPSS